MGECRSSLFVSVLDSQVITITLVNIDGLITETIMASQLRRLNGRHDGITINQRSPHVPLSFLDCQNCAFELARPRRDGAAVDNVPLLRYIINIPHEVPSNDLLCLRSPVSRIPLPRCLNLQ